MSLYNEVPQEFKETARAYLKGGEISRISYPVIFEDKKYFEIVYNKSFLGMIKKEIEGRVIIDAEGRVIGDKNLLRNLTRILYYYSLLLGSQLADLKKITKSEIQLKREETDYSEAASILQKLADEGVRGASRVKEIVDKFPGMRRQSNDVLNETIAKIQEYAEGNKIFSQSALEEILPLYEKTQVMSFERVKYANTASDFYDDVKKEIVDRKKKIRNRVNKKYQDSMIKVESIVQFFINILKFYGDVVNYSTDRYKKIFQKKDDEAMENYYSKLRNI